MSTLEVIASVLIALFSAKSIWDIVINKQNIKAEKEKRAEEREAEKADRAKENKALIDKLSTHISSFETNITTQLSNVEDSVNKRIDKQEKMNIINNEMTLALTRDKLLFLSKKYIREGYIPEDEYETFISLGEAYLAAKGNSVVKKLYFQAKELPIK